MARIDPTKLNLEEKVVQINRVAKVVKGGRRFSFSAVVVVGDGNGIVGAGLGKAGEVPEAIRKGVEDAKKHLIKVPLVGTSIPHAVRVDFGASTVLLRPASPGTGVIAGGSVRSVVEAAGIRDLLSKSMGSTNPVNVVRATIEALRSLRSADQIALQPRHHRRAPPRQARRRGRSPPARVRRASGAGLPVGGGLVAAKRNRRGPSHQRHLGPLDDRPPGRRARHDPGPRAASAPGDGPGRRHRREPRHAATRRLPGDRRRAPPSHPARGRPR